MYRKIVWYLRGRSQFTKSGYDKASSSFNTADLDVDMKGKNCIVTGANSGIGFTCAEAFVKRGATVHMLCRNEERGKEARDKLAQDYSAQENVHLHIVDLSKVESIQKFCTWFLDESLNPNTNLDVLVNNAGCMIHKKKSTDLGLEYNFAVNTFGTFFLTELLIPCLENAQDARVINVSSGGMLLEGLEMDDFNMDNERFDAVKAYSRQKRHQVILAKVWTQRYPSVRFFSMHPGWADTPAFRDSLPDFYEKMKDNIRTPEEGADSAVWLGMSKNIPENLNGCFIQDREASSEHLFLAQTKSTPEQQQEFYEKLIKIAQEHKLL